MFIEHQSQKKIIQWIVITGLFGLTGLSFVAVTLGLNPPTNNPPTGGGSISADTNAIANTVYITSTGNVGIGKTDPTYKLDVASGGATTARLGSSATDQVVVGGGAGKLNVGTIDPVYEINGVKYATYVPGMVGQKEEVSGVIKLQPSQNNRVYQYILDFNQQEIGSDLWLFRQITDFRSDWNGLVVLLTPKFSGRVWYEKSPVQNRLIIWGVPHSSTEKNFEISYRLTAPRFDWQKWGNLAEDQSLEGLKP